MSYWNKNRKAELNTAMNTLATAELLQTPRLENIEGITVIGEHEGLTLAYVELDRIRPEPVAVDEAHVVELEGLFFEQSKGEAGKTGQTDPLQLAEVSGEPQLLIIDGFHRTETLRNIGADAALAIIKPNQTMAQVYDERLKATSAHLPLKFARIASWIEKAWSETQWADTVSVVQVFMMQFQPPAKRELTARRLGLDAGTLDSALRWAAEKTLEWKVPATRIYSDLVDIQRADPDLVQEARGGRNMGARGFLTPQQLKVIARELPHEYMLQKIVAISAKSRRLNIAQTEELARTVSRAQSLEDAGRLINSQNWKQPESEQPRSTTPTRRPILRYGVERTAQPQVSTELTEQTERLLEVIVEDEITIAGLYLALAKQNEQLALAKPESQDRQPVSVDLPSVTDDQKRLLRVWLPHLTEIQRRALLLGTIFRLRKEVVAQVLETDSETIETAIKAAGLAIQKAGI